MLGFGAIILFVLLRCSNVYGDPSRWSVQKDALYTLLSFLNVSKYPPSLLYVLVTLGPALLFLAWSEQPLKTPGSALTVFGRVPMFYYLVHIPMIHGLAVIGAKFSGHTAWDMVNLTTWVTANAQLKGYGFSLLTVYVVWIVAIIVLYPLCKWYDQYKRAHGTQQKWLSYL